MTREEAVENIKLIRFNAAITNANSFKEALDMAIEALSKPSLPSDLDDAAEEYAYTNWQSDDYHEGASEGLPFDAIGHTEKCFKAGAEWMAGQGKSIVAKIGLSTEEICCTISEETLDSLGVQADDEIILQIRKKQ